jgi:hypothetical protein
MEPRVSIITLGVADLRRSREFYERLGWRRSMAIADDAWRRCQEIPMRLSTPRNYRRCQPPESTRNGPHRKIAQNCSLFCALICEGARCPNS